MSIPPISSSRAYAISPGNQQGMIETLQSKIDEWKNSTSADPKHKEAVIARLQTQLDHLTARHEARKETEAPVNRPSSRLDILA